MVIFRQYTIDPVFVRMKFVEACLKLYNGKDRRTHRYPKHEAGDVDKGIISVPE
jgi:hypothetical protein